MTTQLITLYEKTIPSEDFNYIPLEFLCESFSLDYDRQYRNLDNDITYQGLILKISNETVFGDRRKRGHLTKKGFIRWVLQINPTYINDTMRDIFIEYQNNILDYLYDYAIQQESILKKAASLKNRKEVLYNRLYANNEDFVSYINIQAEIARLGKENNVIQQKIAGTFQQKIKFPD